MPDLDANVRIRAARLSDAPQLAALMCELSYETTSDEMRARLKSILPDAGYSTLVAKIGKELCGMIGTLTRVSHEHNDLSGKIIALVVSKKQRRTGVGRALIAAAEKDFAKRNVTRVTLTTRFERDEAHQFYEAAGYLRTGFRFGKNLASAGKNDSKSSVADAYEE
jgi:ribosomal protein S18 acetylase RimI-like enzyme